MADFRKISVLAALVLILAGAASAQQPFNALSCTANAAVPPTVRSEGTTELVGDIVLQCTGGIPTPTGSNIPQVNFTVFLNTAITSRLYAFSSTQNTSESLLIVDEPGTNTNASPLRECLTPFSGCIIGGIGLVDGAGVITPGPLPGPYNGATSPRRPNVYRGLVTGNQVQFLGVPVDAPGTAGVRIFRFTNIRVNANGISSGPSGTPGTIQALVSATGSTSLPINNPTQIVGYVQPGMTFTTRVRTDITSTPNTSTNIAFAQCSSLSRTTTTGAFILQWTEGFPSSFKIRQSSIQQNVPGQIYNTESGFYNTDSSRGDTLGTTGVADMGTRLKAIFNNIPAGVNVYASTNMYPLSSTGSGATGQLVSIEGGAFLAAPASFSDMLTVSGGVGSSSTNTAYQLPVVNGTATAVYEVTGANPLTTEGYNAVVWFNYSANAAQNSPPPGTATVAGSFAPTPTGIGISASTSAAASLTAPIPRFVDGNVGQRATLAIYLCKTNILFPYVTNSAGFDTGLAIANTSLDTGVFATATTPQAGVCTLFQFGDNANPSKASPRIEAGKVWAVLASDSTWFQANYIGYVIASCQFQLGHGFAFVSDFGARNLAMGYLGLIIPEPGNTSRAAAAGGEALDN